MSHDRLTILRDVDSALEQSLAYFKWSEATGSDEAAAPEAYALIECLHDRLEALRFKLVNPAHD